MLNRHLTFVWLILSAVIIAADQWSKLLILDTLQLHESIAVTSFFNLTLAFNEGAAFSFLADAGGWQRWFFTAVALIASVVLFIWLWRTPRKQWGLSLSLSLILGGALGNVIDRIQYGYVVDFLDVYVKAWHWPAFNIADMAISIGAVLLLIDAWFFTEPESDKEKTKTKS